MSLATRLNHILKDHSLFKIQRQPVNILAIGVDYPADLLILIEYFGISTDSITFQNNFKTHIEAAKKLGFYCTTKCKNKHDITILAVPPDKNEALGLIANALRNIKEEGYIIFDGLKSSGIESIIKKLTFLKYKIISKAHGKLIFAQNPEKIPYSVTEWGKALELSLNQDNFFTSPGMFSYRKIDSGSKLLGTFLSRKIKGKVADLCSGWGYLSIAALKENARINQIYLFEANYAALMASKKNITDSRASFHWEDVVNLSGQEKNFDCVLCNPPFHSRAKYDIILGKKIIKASHKILRSSGSFWMVSNKHLPYEKDLKNYFLHVEKIVETSYFKIFKATRPISNV